MADWNNTVPEGVVRDGTYPTNTQAINNYGQCANNNEGLKPTYSAAVSLTLGASQTGAIFSIENPAASAVTMRINHILVSGRSTAANQLDLVVNKRSSLNSGGTMTTPTAVAHDSNDSAASGVVRAYTVAPTPGTLVGAVRTFQVNMSAVGSGGASSPALWDFGWRNGRAIVLHPGQTLTHDLTVSAPSGTVLDFEIEWTEEVPNGSGLPPVMPITP